MREIRVRDLAKEREVGIPKHKPGDRVRCASFEPTRICNLCEIAKCSDEACVFERMETKDGGRWRLAEFYGGIQTGVAWAYYVKRPIPVRAVQTKKDGEVSTLEGTMRYSAGDYLVEGVQKEVYPVRKDIFEKSYVHVVADLTLDKNAGVSISKGEEQS